MAKIVVTNSSAAGASHEVGGNWATIGRADGNTFQIVEASVSGRHCEVRMQGEELQVRDLLSTNGTFIGGKKVTEGALKMGQTLRLGDVEMRLEASAPAPAPAEKPGTSFTSKMLFTNATTQNAAKSAVAPTVAEAKPAAQVNAGPEPARKFQLLFVDDSLAFLETFGGLCSEYAKRTWEIHSATSADKALAVLNEKPIDLVVLDVGMPMLDGLQLLGIITKRYPGLKVAVMTGSATESKRADALANGAALFLEKPMTADGMKSVFNMLNDLVSWTHREGFSGSLRQVGLTEVVQMECLGKHSSVLEIHNQEMRGEVCIEDGAIIHAVVGTLEGEQAFYRLMSLKGGEFKVKPFKIPAHRTIETRWEFLLMDSARASDEETVLLTKPPEKAVEKLVEKPVEKAVEPPKAIQPAPAIASDEVATPEATEAHALGEDIIVVATYDGEWKPKDGPKPEPGK